ncbi:MAG: S8 family serine peptidase [Bacteroidota bacterium]|nr:S8 family serine peptidase [Bacteroidota bacterium]
MRWFLSFFIFFVFNIAFAQKEYGILNRHIYLKNQVVSGLTFCGFFNSENVYVVLDKNKFNQNDLRLNITPLKPILKLDLLWQENKSDLQKVNIYCYENNYLDTVINWLISQNNKGIYYKRLSFNAVSATISFNDINLLSNLDGVKRISISAPQNQEINQVERTNHRINQFGKNYPELDSNSLTGNGVIIGEWDAGGVGNHIDINSHFKVIKSAGISQHATHVGGTMSGRGNLSPLYRGMAPNAMVFSWDFMGDIPLEMDTNKLKLNYRLTQNSYGYWTSNCIDFANYDAISNEMDILSNKYEDLLHVYAAGNSRTMNCISGGYGTILSGFQSAKNTISVAAVDRFDNEANFSSAGPTKDGRMKPEISAVGVNVISTGHSNVYYNSSGTSMATPGATGVFALMYEKFFKINGFYPTNYLAKNILANSADDVGNAGPDFKHGFGRINGRIACQLIDSNFWKLDSLSNNQYYWDSIIIPSGLNQLKVMLTWNDPEVSPNTNPTLVNDLDLTIIDPNGNTILPWVCNPSIPNNLATRKRDSLNNIEQVSILNPSSGKYYFKVYGKNITGNQDFALTYFKENKAINVVYPNGGERMSPPSNTANAQIIRWDAKGITGTFTVQFSIDSGSSWTTLASNIANNINYYTWQNLSDTVSTSKALIKVSANGNEDVSDQNFHITSGILLTNIQTTLCKSQVFLRWKKTKQTKQYHIAQLINGKMERIGSTHDTSFLIKNLDNQSTQWFALTREDLNGAISQRSTAFSAKPDSTNLPPSLTLDLRDTALCFNQSYSAISKAVGSLTINSIWQFSTDSQNTWNTINDNNDSIYLKNYTNANQFHIRRQYTNNCLAPVYSHSAYYQIDTPLNITFKELDTTVCFQSLWRDSVSFKSVTKPFVTWYRDSFNQTKIIQSGEYYSVLTSITYPQSIWLEISNFCETKQTKDLSKSFRRNGLNTYLLHPKPEIQIPDIIDACIGEILNINPILLGGKPGQQVLIIQTEDSLVQANNLWLKIIKDQTVSFKYFDDCYPDTIYKTIQIKMRNPLSLNLLQDSTICYNGTAKFNTIASGGNKPYIFTWSDIGIGSSSRWINGLKNTQTFILELSDNCTEKKVYDTVTIQVKPPLSVNLSSSNDTLCYGNTLNLNAMPSGGDTSSYMPLWQNSTINDFVSNTPVYNSSYLKFRLSDGCSPDVVDSIYVFVWDKPSIKITPMDTLCHNKNITLNATISGGLPNKTSVYWYPLNKSGQNITYTPTSSQNIIAQISDACSLPDVYDTLWVPVYEPLQLINIKDTNTCFGKPISLKISSKGGKTNTVQYFWGQENKQTTSLDSFSSQSYLYQIKDACLDSLSANVLVNVSPKLQISPSLIHKCSYNDLIIEFNVNTSLPYSMKWDKLADGNIQFFSNKNTEFYRVNIQDGCSDTSWQNIEVRVTDFSNNDLKIDQVFNKQVQVDFTDIIETNNIIQYWNNQELEMSSDEKQYTYQDFGQYKICRIAADYHGCFDTICIYYDNSNPAGFKQFIVQLFPNPINDILSFQLNQLCKDLKIEIIDAIGKTIFNDHQVYPGILDFKIPFQSFSHGVYFLRLNINGELKTFKFVK